MHVPAIRWHINIHSRKKNTLNKFAFFLLSLIAVISSCESPSSPEVSNSTGLELDSTNIIQLAANDILKNLDAYIIVQSGFDNYGNFKIVFHEESTDEEMEDLIHEYYSLEKSSIRIGDLDNDGKEDFALESIWGPIMGNLYATTGHVYLQDNGSWMKVPSNIQGGKGSSSESIVSIEKGVLNTEFRAFDMDTYQLVDSIEKRTYGVEDGVLILN